MKAIPLTRSGLARIELLLLIALVALLFQLFPSLWTSTLIAIDIRNWPRTIWFALNWIVVASLVAIRFGPELFMAWRQRRERIAHERKISHERRELKQQRETIERIQQARSRRIN
jgi:uncharacterized membrane protein YqjE